MREVIDLNKKWAFSKEACQIPTEMPTRWIYVDLPHTWNNIDGQDGGGDYYRGRCFYAKELPLDTLPVAEKYYIEFGAANSSAEVYLNGTLIGKHDGGYSRFRIDLTESLRENNLLVVAVDNSPRDDVYPQMADFTFYGGLYRGTKLICVSKTHFQLDHFGADGLAVTPTLVDKDARVDVEVWIDDPIEGDVIRYRISDREGREVSSLESSDTSVSFFIEDVKKWHGTKSPYLYTLTAEIWRGGEIIDTVSTSFGCRSFSVDPERGFILNGEEYPLRGVSRHQDREGIGSALLPDHHREDMRLIGELGANTVRLAHYAQDPFVYELCDEMGFIVWAEIPYISKHLPRGVDNTVSQMTELILQNYNHPSIAVWGLSNEITMGGESDELIENHKILNELCHTLDKTRYTAVAAVSPCPTDSEYLKIPDLVAYNHYFGWYGGDVSMNGEWFDKFHTEHPNIPIGCSEYGCEGLNWHTSSPEQGDYTEEYQAYYHEELIKQLFKRKYLWVSYVWNMFDFGADARGEGGEPGQNHKGLVSFHRKYKKDAFYAYKAWLSDEPFVHIAGKRYVDRMEEVTRVTVYSNLPEVELFANGKSLGKKKCDDHFFYFDVPNKGITELLAKAGECEDTGSIRKVDSFNEKYRMKEHGAILNWFDITEREGYYSLNDKISDIMKNKKAAETVMSIIDTAKSAIAPTQEQSADMMKMLGSFTLVRFIGLLGAMGPKLTREEMLRINKNLNEIKKEDGAS